MPGLSKYYLEQGCPGSTGKEAINMAQEKLEKLHRNDGSWTGLGSMSDFTEGDLERV